VKKFLFLLLCLASIGAGQTRPAGVQPPNILWIYLEDVSGWFSCYGEQLIATPNIDALAAAGTRFTRFYTPAGVCSATRSAIVLGAMQTTFGVHNHTSSRNHAAGTRHDGIGMIHLPKGVTPVPQLFRQHGIYTFNEGGKDDYNFVFKLADLYDFVPAVRAWGPPHLIAGDCWAGLKPGQAFFGQVQLGGGKLGKAAPKRADRAAVPVPPYYPDIPEVREEIAHHYDCLLKTDAQVGEVIAALKRAGHYDNTVIFLLSDHGYRMHRHKQFVYAGGINMPLIVSGPGIPRGQVRDDLVSGIDLAPASLAAAGLPIPSHMEGRNFLASDHRPREYVVAARDRCDHTIERIRTIVTPRFQYLRNYMTDRPFMQPSYKDPWPVSIKLREMMARGEMNGAQLVFFGPQKPAEELYDVAGDPHQIRNLVDDPAAAAELNRHRKLLADWIAKTGDRGQFPEDDAGLIQVLYERGDRAVNPEYDRLRPLIQPKVR
jgi:arylsulfatase A-like enzyme